jgi:hypothetical protein
VLVEYWLAFDSDGRMYRGTVDTFGNLPEPLMACCKVFEEEQPGEIVGEWLCGSPAYHWNTRAKTLEAVRADTPLPPGSERRSGVRMTDAIGEKLGDLADPIFAAILQVRADAGPA